MHIHIIKEQKALQKNLILKTKHKLDGRYDFVNYYASTNMRQEANT